MSNTILDENSFFKKLKELGVTILPNVPEYYEIIGSTKSSNYSEYDKKIMKMFSDTSKKLNLGEEKLFITPKRNFLYIVSNDYILGLMGSCLNVFDTSCNKLFSLNYSYLNKFFSIHNHNFTYLTHDNNKKKPEQLLWYSNSSGGRDVRFSLIGDNTLKISSTILNVTKFIFYPEINAEHILVKFKSLPFTSINFDSHLNAKKVEFNKDIKKVLNVDGAIDILEKCENELDIIKYIENKFKDNLDIHSLLEDSIIFSKDINRKSYRNFNYIEHIINNKKNIFNVFDKTNLESLKKIKDYYIALMLNHENFYSNINKIDNGNNILNEYTSFTKDRYAYVLSFILIKNQLNIPFIKKDVLDNYKKIDSDAEKAMSFNSHMLKLKSKKELKI